MPSRRKRSTRVEVSRPFARVWQLVRRIPRGRVASYGQLSLLVGRRLTPVGVGWAVGAAPEGAIPWQRVVNARGGISTDGAHPGLQRAMLEAEGVRFGRDGRVDLAKYGWRPRSSATAWPARRRADSPPETASRSVRSRPRPRA